jgi:ABC-type transport system substrate-binding protein
MKLHLASFFLFLKKKKFPTQEDIAGVLNAPTSTIKTILILLTLLCVSLFLSILLRLSDQISVIVPEPGGSITLGVIGAPRYINPLLSTSETDKLLSTLVYDGLMRKNDDGSLSPLLASDCSSNPDETSYQCTLPETLQFSNKTPLTASDVVFTFETKKALVLRNDPVSDWASISAEALSVQSVVVRTSGSAESLKKKLTLGIVPKALWEGISLETMQDSTLNMDPVGAGAFIVKNIKVVGTIPTEVSLKPNPRYFSTRPFVDSLIVRSFANQLDLKTNTKVGAVDSTSSLRGTFIDTDFKDNFSITPMATERSVSLFMNQNQAGSALASRLSSASPFIDRNRIIDTIENGYGSPLPSQDGATRSSVLPPLSLSIAVQKDDELIATAELLSNMLTEFGIISTVNVFDQGLFSDQLQLGTFSFVLVANTDTIQGYQRLIPLYTKTIAHISAPDIHMKTPTIVEASHEYVRDARLWYVRTDKVWKWFK